MDALRNLVRASSLADAPKAWRAVLRPAHSPLTVSQDVVRLSERPLPASAGAAWRQPQAGVAADPPPAGPLPVAPIAGLYAQGAGGLLPIIGADGRTAFDAYRRPFLPNGRPRVALVIYGLGLDPRTTDLAIESLPAEITLAFSPYADNLQAWVDKARAHGHEVMLETPMEPIDYPDNDPGPYTLLAQAPPADTAKKMEWTLSRATGYFGLTNNMGSRFLTTASAYGAFATVARGRGLAFVDDGAARPQASPAGLLRASAERSLDVEPAHAAIDQQLLALESSAQQRGQALAGGHAYPVTLETLAGWAHSLDARGFQLAPASAMVGR